MPSVKCNIIPQPEEGTRTVLVKIGNPSEPFIIGQGKTTYTCGRCTTILVDRVYHGQIRNIVFKCPKCGSYNEIP